MLREPPDAVVLSFCLVPLFAMLEVNGSADSKITSAHWCTTMGCVSMANVCGSKRSEMQQLDQGAVQGVLTQHRYSECIKPE